mmetsp:Transcript_14215/g.30030  ORF Transcript_14215/g.30030 Transcript_14215/m.30030 type:complete len:256 (+) Transcript_14215:841-1608(+)
MASAQSTPAERHCCSALAISVNAALRLPARRSSRTASNQSIGACVIFRRPTSRSERALLTCPCFSSSLAASSHIGTHSTQSLSPFASVSRAASCAPMRLSICALTKCSFHARGCARSAGVSSPSAASRQPRLRSSTIDLSHTRSVPARSRAFESRSLARSGSSFSDSSFTAASHTCSESGFARKASVRMVRAAATSPAIHFSLAPMSHSTCACGQYETALRSSVSSESLVPWFFSCCAARIQTDFLVGKICSACA